jgi:hypothetical protein
LISLVAISILLLVTIPKEWMGESDDLNVAGGMGELRHGGIVVGYSMANDSGLSYSTDYSVCINGLNDDPLQLFVLVDFENLEPYTGYFRLESSGIPPAGWVVKPLDLGWIYFHGGTSVSFPVTRSNPSSIAQGESIEQINLAVKGYADYELTDLRSQRNFTVTYHLIDCRSSVWTVLENDTFDATSTEGWTGPGLSVSPKYYLSFPYSLRSRVGTLSQGWSYSKSFQINYSTAYLICPIISNNGFSSINIDGKTCFAVTSGAKEEWCQLTIPLGRGSTTVLIFGSPTSDLPDDYGLAYMDDVLLIAK